MSDQNKGFQKEEAPKTVQGAQGSPSAWKRLLAKKWVFPATYVAAAAIILTLMWVYQDAGTKTVSQDDLGIKVSSNDIKHLTIPKMGRSPLTHQQKLCNGL